MFLGKAEPVELRAYEPFTVARTSMERPANTPAGGGEGFNTLASYLFGENEAKTAMPMTTPVETCNPSDGSASTMAFVLPKQNVEVPPTPLASSRVRIEEVPERLVLVKAFGGIV